MTTANDLPRLRIGLTVHHPLDLNAGAAGTTMRLGTALEGLGHEVSIVAFDSMPLSRRPISDQFVFPLYVAHDVGRSLRLGDLDVVVASTGDLWSLRKQAISRSRAAVITRSHGLEHLGHLARVAASQQGELALRRRYFLYHGGLRLHQVARSLRIADAVIFLNDHERTWAIDHLGVTPDRAVTGRNGLADELVGLPEPVPPPPGGGIGIAVMGGFSFRKGSATAAAVLTRFLADHHDSHAKWYGAEPEVVRGALRPEVRDRVEIVREYQVPDLPLLLRDLQVLLFPSRFEGFGNVVIEAMACGLAPVASDIPGPRDIVTADAGVLVPPGDTEGFVSSLSCLYADRLTLQALRQGAYHRGQEYSWQSVAGEQVDIYRRVLAEKEHTRTRRSSFIKEGT